MTTPFLDHENRLTLTVEIGPDATLEELYSDVERFLRDRREELRVRAHCGNARAFLLAEQSYLEPPVMGGGEDNA